MRDTIKKNNTNREYYARNKARILAELKLKYETNEGGHRDKIINKQRKYIKNNKDKEKTRKKIDKQNNPIRYSLYWRWKNMINRCSKQKDKDYLNYGARGISVIAPLDNFQEYKKYVISLVEKPEDIIGMHIDRIDNDGNYEIGNLRVITVKENLENSRNKKNNPRLKGE